MQQFALLPSLWWALLLIPLTALAWWKTACLPLLFFVGGMIWVTLQAGSILAEQLPEHVEGKDIWVEGYIADLPKATERGARIKFEVKHAHFEGKAVLIPRKLQLSIAELPEAIQLGDEWGLLVRLKRPHGFQNPGGFDHEGHLFRERIRATGYVRNTQAAQLIASDPYSYPLGRLRQHVGNGIRSALQQSEFAGIITAFANGDESAITDQQWNILRRTGTTHLIAISGMNIGLIAGIAFFLVRWLWALPGLTVLRLPAQKAAALAAMLGALFYAALAGFAIPTQRALIMLSVIMGAILISRSVKPSSLLATALFLVLLYDPLAVMSAGFWLSFAAVAVILLAINGRVGESRWSQWGRIQWVIAIGLLPMMLAMFQQTTLSGPFANMLAIPVIEIIVIPLTLLGVISLMILPTALANFLFQLAAATMDRLWVALDYLAGFDHSQWTQHTPLTWTLVCATIGILLLLAPRGWPARWVGVLWVLPMFLIRPSGPAPGEVEFTLLDVGQGLAAVARTEHHTLVFDTGPRFSVRFDTGAAVVVPYLRHSGLHTLDRLIISHADNDHMGGAQSVIKSFPIKRVLSSVPEKLAGGEYCQAGKGWRWDGVEFIMLNPVSHDLSENNASCVLLIRTPHGSILLTGDIESEAEHLLVTQWRELLRADVLVAPHHGSKTSSTEAFLDAVNPKIVLFPAGYKNRYGHPHPAIVQRYAEHKVRMLESPAQGAITIELRAQGMDISAYRQDHKRYWHSE